LNKYTPTFNQTMRDLQFREMHSTILYNKIQIMRDKYLHNVLVDFTNCLSNEINKTHYHKTYKACCIMRSVVVITEL